MAEENWVTVSEGVQEYVGPMSVAELGPRSRATVRLRAVRYAPNHATLRQVIVGITGQLLSPIECRSCGAHVHLVPEHSIRCNCPQPEEGAWLVYYTEETDGSRS